MVAQVEPGADAGELGERRAGPPRGRAYVPCIRADEPRDCVDGRRCVCSLTVRSSSVLTRGCPFPCGAAALVQLFTIASTSNERLQKYTRPLGATIIIIGLCTLFIGVVRYFTIQSLLLKGLYPAARMVAVAIALALCAIIIAVFGILVGNR